MENLLRAEGFSFTPEPFFPLARRLADEPLPLGASLAAAFGYIYIQDRSSMLPPLVLAPPPGAAVLDMCASPGSKTGLIGQLVGDSGFALGNEPSKNRLATLRRNLQTMNSLCCATCSHPGEQVPLPGADAASPPEALPEAFPEALADAARPDAAAPGWNFIQLDPPCSGWGTVEKNPQVKQLWQGEKVQPLILLQRRLLAEATRLLRPGGLLAYSTCTTNTAENEEQVRYARDELGLSLVPAGQPDGFAFARPALPGFDGVLRVDTGADGQGFFVALLRKPQGFAPRPDDAEGSTAPRPLRHSLEQGFFSRPWEKESRFVGERRRHGKTKRGTDESSAHILPRESLAGPFTDPGLLPPGDIAVFNGVAHFLPALSRGLLPTGFAWKGFPLGKAAPDGRVRVNPRLRRLMPEADSPAARGLPRLNLEDIAPIRALLSGRSLPVDAAGPEIGLYFRDLPLCRLQIKGKRALLPAS